MSLTSSPSCTATFGCLCPSCPVSTLSCRTHFMWVLFSQTMSLQSGTFFGAVPFTSSGS